LTKINEVLYTFQQGACLMNLIHITWNVYQENIKPNCFFWRENNISGSTLRIHFVYRNIICKTCQITFVNNTLILSDPGGDAIRTFNTQNYYPCAGSSILNAGNAVTVSNASNPFHLPLLSLLTAIAVTYFLHPQVCHFNTIIQLTIY